MQKQMSRDHYSYSVQPVLYSGWLSPFHPEANIWYSPNIALWCQNYMHSNVYIHTDVYALRHMYKHAHILTYMCTHACLHTHMHTYINTQLHRYKLANINPSRQVLVRGCP